MTIALEMFTKTFYSDRTYRSTSSNKELDIYLNDTISFTNLLTIKSLDAAQLSDAGMIDQFPAYNKQEPESGWKYYLNLNGQYHPLTDSMLYINSIDTLEQIEFTKENMEIHKNTRDSYIKDTRKLTRLIARYSEYEVLIRGILNPIPIDLAIAAKDGEILYYPEHLVEHNEYSLIEDLNKWISNFKDRWHIKGYLHTDPLYVAAHLSLLYTNIPLALMNLRENRIHTLEVHSFHVRQYLASHGLIDRYVNWLNFYQRLFLYRNMKYLKKHAGHNKSFLKIVKNVLENRQIPLDGMLENHVNEDNIITARFTRKGYSNDITSVGPDVVTLKEYVNKEYDILSANDHSENDHLSDINISKYGRMKSKMLDSTTLDYSGSEPYPLLSVLYNHWTYMSLSGLYNTYIDIPDVSSNTSVTISVRDGVVFTLVLLSEILEQPLERLPGTLPIDLIYTGGRVEHDSYTELVPITNKQELITHLTYIDSLLPVVDTYISIITFSENITDVYVAYDSILSYINKVEHGIIRSVLHRCLTDLFTTKVVTVSDNELVSVWRTEHRIIDSPDNASDKVKLFNEIITKSTGYDPDAIVGIKDIQNSALGILEQLSSYSIQLSGGVNADPIKVGGWVYDRVCQVTGTESTGLSSIGLIDHVSERDYLNLSQTISNDILYGRVVNNDSYKLYSYFMINERNSIEPVNCPRGRKSHITREFVSMGTLRNGTPGLEDIPDDRLSEIKSVFEER